MKVNFKLRYDAEKDDIVPPEPQHISKTNLFMNSGSFKMSVITTTPSHKRLSLRSQNIHKTLRKANNSYEAQPTFYVVPRKKKKKKR